MIRVGDNDDTELYVFGRCCMYNRRWYILSSMWCGMPLEVVCDNHSPALIYGWYLLWTGVYCGAWCAPGAASACCSMASELAQP